MGGTVDNRATWNKFVLFLFWIIELILEIAGLVISARLLHVLNLVNHTQSCTIDDSGNEYCGPLVAQPDLAPLLGAEGASVAMASIFILFHFIQIGLFATHRLTPGANLGLELPRFLLWTIAFILFCVATSYSGTTVGNLVYTVLLEAAYIGSLAYACIVFHHRRTIKNNPDIEMYHQQPTTHGGHGYTDNQNAAERRIG